MKTLIVTPVIYTGIGRPVKYYLDRFESLKSSYLKYTNFDILVVTNIEKLLKDKTNKRITYINLSDFSDEPLISGIQQRFNMHLKRLPIRIGSELNYEIIYFHDCDCWITGWDDESYNKLLEKNYDIIFPTTHKPQLGGLRKTYPHFQEKLDTEYGDLYKLEFDEAPNAAETRIIFKNTPKLTVFLDFWDKIAFKNDDYTTYHSGVYFGTSAVESKMTLFSVTPDDKFSRFGRIHHGNKILDYHGRYIEL